MKVTEVSYAGKPIDNTAMYITKKVEYLINNLEHSKGCLVFVESSISVPNPVEINNTIVKCINPQLEYIKYVQNIEKERKEINNKRKYFQTEGLYIIGENVSIGKNETIEPGCVIGHDVIIGDNAVIKAGAIIKNSIIGDNFICCEGCIIGTSGFTIAEDENGDKIRIPTLGKVIIGNNVEIGANSDVPCGSAGNTILEDNVKVDALVHIGHDNMIKKNAEITCGAILGGFNNIGEKAFVGFNASTKNRINVGNNVIVGMGAAALKTIEDGDVVAGVPAKKIK